MHIREFSSEVRRFKGKVGSQRSPLHVGSALSVDARFKPIARTGFWILRESKEVEMRTIADIAAVILSKAKKSLTEAELYQLIAQRRQLGRNSVMSLLREDGRFRRVGPRTWKLKQSSITHEE
jgi:hypothetical protein